MPNWGLMKRDGGDRGYGPRPPDRRSDRPSRRGPGPSGAPRPLRTMAFWLVLLVLTVLIVQFYYVSRDRKVEISYSTFMTQVDAKNIKRVTMIEREVTGEFASEITTTADGRTLPVKQFKVYLPAEDSDLPKTIRDSNPQAEIDSKPQRTAWSSYFVTWFPIILFIGLWLFLLRQMQAGGSTALKFGKSRAKILLESNPKITFKDVAGADEAKQELQEIIEFLKEPKKFQALGGRIPKGALLLGPPGTGKTLLGRAVAGEAGVPFFSMSGSDFVEMFVGVGASRVRDLFEQGKRNAPCVTGDAVVSLSDGRRVTIQQMFEQRMAGVSVSSMTDDLRLEDATVLGITCKRCTDLRRITTNTSSIKATGNHLFPVLRSRGVEWVRADRLRAGDSVAAPRRSAAATARAPGGPTALGDHACTGGPGPAIAPGAGPVALLKETPCDILWAKVQSVEEIEPVERVYDLCLDRHHNFIANDLVVHNCIIFIDEIDAVGRHRGAGLGGGHDEREQTLNQLLVEMDGFESNEGVILLAATNRPDVLDPALLRPGRFDRQIVVDRPDVRGREGILRVHTRNIPLADDVDLSILARGTPGLAGAELANLVNEAALLAARKNRKRVVMQDLEEAKDKVMMGMERKIIITDAEKRSTAYHESGHALVAEKLPLVDPIHKMTVIPRGRALGVTHFLPADERFTHNREYLTETLASIMGGRAAEEVVFGQITNGAANDIQTATEVARKMVCEWGMSDKLGPIQFGKREEMIFLGREISQHKDYSEQTAILIDEEIRNLVEGAHQRALQILRENMDTLHGLAEALLEREILDAEEINKIIQGEKLEPPRRAEDDGRAAPAKPEAGKGDAARPESGGRADARKPDAGKPEAGRSEAGRSEAGKPEADPGPEVPKPGTPPAAA